MASRIREEFLNQNRNKNIKVIINNGFQIHGMLRNFDDTVLLLETDAYSSGPVVISLNSITTLIPSGYKK